MQKRTAGGYVHLTASPQLRRQEEREALRTHHETVLKAKPRLNTWNETFVHVHTVHRNNRRTNRVEEAKQKKIQYENSILVEHMTRTVLRQPGSTTAPGGSTTAYQTTKHRPPAQHTTLNYLVRKHERERILKDNLIIAKRLIEQRPMISTNDWSRHAREHQRLRESLSKYAVAEDDVLYKARKLRAHEAGAVTRESGGSSSRRPPVAPTSSAPPQANPGARPVRPSNNPYARGQGRNTDTNRVTGMRTHASHSSDGINERDADPLSSSNHAAPSDDGYSLDVGNQESGRRASAEDTQLPPPTLPPINSNDLSSSSTSIPDSSSAG